MAHPFFDATSFPWARPEARALYAVLTEVVTDPREIRTIYAMSGGRPADLDITQATASIWTDALTLLATGGLLSDFCTQLEAVDRLQRNKAFQTAVRDVVNAEPAAELQVSQPYAGPVAPAKPERPIKILFLAANPIDTERLRLDEEMRAIDRALREAQYRDRFEIEQQWAVRIGDLHEALLRYQPDIVHFSGHGTEASEIVLEDESGTGRAVPQDALGRLFSVLRDNIRCVVLNACYSEEQAQAIADHIDCVVGMTNAVGDDAAIEFATAFYRALGYGRNVQTAFDLGTNLIGLQDLPDADTPHLVAKKGSAKNVSFVASG